MALLNERQLHRQESEHSFLNLWQSTLQLMFEGVMREIFNTALKVSKQLFPSG